MLVSVSGALLKDLVAMPNSPFPCSLKSEAQKAAKILRDFVIPSTTTGPDRIIPGTVIKSAKGLAIITVVKAGFLLSARGGSGIVVARLDDGGWSAPSAIGIAGIGGGLEIGAEVTDFVIILNTHASVQAFSKGGNVTLGGNLTVAAGPLGRNMEGDVAVRGGAAVYTYSKTKGLFVGLSIEGSAIIERKEANRKFYGDSDIRAYSILSGDVSPPAECKGLYEVLERHDEMAEKAAAAPEASEAKKAQQSSESCGDKPSVPWQHRSSADMMSTASTHQKETPKSQYQADSSRSRSKSTSQQVQQRNPWTAREATPSVVQGNDDWTRQRAPPSKTAAPPRTRSSTTGTLEAPLTVTVLYPFQPQMDCDLDLRSGDVIEVTARTSTAFDWWEGRLRGRIGLFPANHTSAANYISSA